jgi:chemotaxis protein MotB
MEATELAVKERTAMEQQLCDALAARDDAQIKMLAAREEVEALKEHLAEQEVSIAAERDASLSREKVLQQELEEERRAAMIGKQATGEVESLKGSVAGLTDENQRLEGVLQRARAECSVWEEEAKQGSAAAQTAAQEREELQDRLDASEEELRRMQRDHQTLLAERDEAGADVEAMLAHLQTMKDECGDLRAEVSERDAQLAGMQARESELSTEVSALREQVAASRNSDVEHGLQAAASSGMPGASEVADAASVQALNVALRRAEHAEAEVQRLETQLAEGEGNAARELEHTAQSLKEQNKALSEELEDMLPMIERLQGSKMALERELSELHTQARVHERELADLRELQSTVDAQDGLSAALSAAHKRIAELEQLASAHAEGGAVAGEGAGGALEQACAELQDVAAQAEERARAALANVQKLEDQLEATRLDTGQRIRLLEEQLTALEGQGAAADSALQTEVHRLEGVVAVLQGEAAAASKALQAEQLRTEEKESQVRQLASAVHECESLRSAVQDLRDAEAALLARQQESEGLLREEAERRQAVEMQLAAAEQQAETLQTHHRHLLKDATEQQQQQADALLRQFKEQAAEQHSSALEGLQTNLDRIRAERDAAHHQLQDLSVALSEARGREVEANGIASDAVSEAEKLRDALNAARSHVPSAATSQVAVEVQRERDGLRAELDDMLPRFEEVLAERDSLWEQLQRGVAQRDGGDAEVAAQRERLRVAEASAAGAQQEGGGSERETQLKATVAEAHARIEELQQQVRASVLQSESLHAERAQLQQECSRLQGAVYSAEAQAAAARQSPARESARQVAEATRAQMELHQRVSALQSENQALRVSLESHSHRHALPLSASSGSTVSPMLHMDHKKLDDPFSDLEAGTHTAAGGVRSRAVFVPLVNTVRAAPWPIRSSAVEATAGALDQVFVFGASRPRIRSACMVVLMLLVLYCTANFVFSGRRLL